MRIPYVAFAVVSLLLLSSDSPAKADFLLNCRFIDSGNPIYRQHCKEGSVVRIKCHTEKECLLLRKLINSSGAISDVGGSSLVTGTTGTASSASSQIGGAVSGAGSAVGGAVSSTGSQIGGAVSGAGSAVGGAVSSTGNQLGGTVSGAGSAVGGVVSGAASRLGGRL